MTKGIILSGGWGTRLRPLTCTIPKTLIPVVNKPVIERQMLLLKTAGVKEIILAVSVMGDTLKNYFKEGEKLGIKIYYTDEKNPMGTAGAIKLAEDYLNDDNFFMLNGDVILNFDFNNMVTFHEENNGIGTNRLQCDGFLCRCHRSWKHAGSHRRGRRQGYLRYVSPLQPADESIGN